MENLKELILVEKYRPKYVNDIISEYTDKIKKYLNGRSTPHFLFASRSPGTGKTSMALAIINELGCDSLILNSSDDRKIETIRDKVKIFVRSQSSKQNMKRCVMFDEFDGMLKPSQNALRNMMETYSKNCFFILTCNSVEKVIEPIQSRCVYFNLSNPPKAKIMDYLRRICKEESVQADEESLKRIINRFYPDIRSMIQFIQVATIEKIGLCDVISKHIDCYEKCLRLILNKKFSIIKDMIFTGELDPRSFNEWLFKNIFKYKERLGTDIIKAIIQILADNELAFAYGANEDIIFLANLLKIIKALRNVE